MKPLDQILDELQRRGDCRFVRPTRLPALPSGLLLPSDLAAFYGRFGGGEMFGSRADPRCRILSAAEFVEIGMVIYGEPTGSRRRTRGTHSRTSWTETTSPSTATRRDSGSATTSSTRRPATSATVRSSRVRSPSSCTDLRFPARMHGGWATASRSTAMQTSTPSREQGRRPS